METLELSLNETQELSFDVDIQGITNEKVDVKFIIETDGMDLSFEGKMESGNVIVDLPILSETLKPKTYQAKMAFIIEGVRYFEPMRVMVDMIQPISITASVNESKKTVINKESKEVHEDISFGNITVTKTKPIMERMEECFPEMVKSTSIGGLLEIYKKDVLLKEDADVSGKDAIQFIDAFTKDKHGKTFSEYVKANK
jgi:hypothetical protein